MENTIGNVSTVGKFIATMMAGWVISVTVAHGLDLGVDAKTLAEVIGAILGLLYGYIDAKYPNSFGWLGNSKPAIDSEEPVMNDEYEVDDDGY